jgi:diguanylate cyclase (GGDEF)-like protein/PAS domain S-box-containing protein
MSLRRLISRSAVRISLVYLVLAGLWILASDVVLELLAGAAPDVVSGQTLKGLAFVLFTTVLLYLLLRRQHFSGEQHRGGEQGDISKAAPRSWLPLLIFVLFSLGLIATGLFLFHVQREQIRADAEAQLRAVGELRIEQIKDWLNAARANARHFGRASQRVVEFDAWVKAGGTDMALGEKILWRLNLIEESYGHADITLFDARGMPRLSNKSDSSMAEHRAEALQVMASGKPLLVDFHRHGGGEVVLLGMFAPLILDDGKSERTVGAMFFSLPTEKTLFSMIRRWPTASASGETVLVQEDSQKDGELRILFASRHKAPLGGVTVPRGNPNRVGYRALAGERGIQPNAVDFRGDPVLAFADRIPGTPWLLVTKFDQNEVDAPVHRLARGTALVIGLLLLSAALVAWLWWRAQLNRQRAQLLSKELERKVLERHYDYLSRYANDAILLVDMQGRLVDANERVREMYGHGPDVLIGQPVELLRPPEVRDGYTGMRDQILASGQLIYETVHQHRDGRRFPVEASARLIDQEGMQRIHISVRDISERMRNEQALQEREARYRAVIETSADGFWMTDLEGHLLEVNDAYCRMSGYSREELLDMRIGDLDARERPEETRRHVAEIIASGSSLFETLHRAKDGTIWQVEVNAAISLETDRIFAFLRDVNQRSRSEALLRTRLQLSDLALTGSLDDLMKAALDAAELFTGSHIGFFHFVDADQENLTLQAWSSNTVDRMCTIEALRNAKGMHYAISQAGVWADCIRQRRSLIHNDYAGMSDKKGLPAGHAPLLRELVVPILREDKVTAVLGVGNKSDDYTQEDLRVAEQIASMVMDVVARKHAEQALRESESYNKLLFADSRMAMVVLDPETLRFIDCNQAAADIYGLPDRQSVLKLDIDNVSSSVQYDGSDNPTLARRNVERALTEGSLVFEWRHRRPNGEIWDAQVNLMRFQHGERKLLQFTLEDITQRKRAEAQLKQAAMVFESIADGIIITDARLNIVAVNRAFTEVTGFSPAEALGRTPKLLSSGRHGDDYYRDMWQTLAQAGYWHGEIWNRRRNGEIYPEWLAITAVKADHGEVSGYIGVFNDLSEQHALQYRLEQATHFDPLTGLSNARRLLNEVAQAMQASQHSGGQFALLVLNVDRFAQLNESLGRGAGDSVLVSLAQRWSAILPASALLARLDADQFAVLWRDDRAAGEERGEAMVGIMDIANSLLQSMAAPIEAGEHKTSVALTLSVGIAIYPGDAEDANGLLHAAEDAMRSAKMDKGNQSRFFDRRHAQSVIDWFETEAALRLALERDELFLAYQPQVDAASGRVVAAECLLRWRRNEQVVPPGLFIHVVEGTDLAEPVSRWVLNTACRQARLWLDRKHPLRVAVNIFSDHVTSGRLLDDVRQALADSGLPAAMLELEVVESSLLKNPEVAAQTLREIKRIGVGLALDDFGTGYSSLGYLKHYPFDVLKIDQIFARNVTRDPEDAAIVRSTIALAHNLNMRVLAEGVETEPQLRFMARYGCDQIQGYLTCRPTSADVVETLVMERRDLRPVGQVMHSPLFNVLIVEDEPIESELMSLMLRDAGYGTHAVADLESALNVMGKQRVDLIISDYYLEKTTGVEVLAHLRRLFPEVPRIMVSGANDSSVVMQAVNRAGVLAFLPKPIEFDTLLAAIRGLMDNIDHGRDAIR